MFYNMIGKNNENDHVLFLFFVACKTVLCIKPVSINKDNDWLPVKSLVSNRTKNKT